MGFAICLCIICIFKKKKKLVLRPPLTRDDVGRLREKKQYPVVCMPVQSF